MPRTEAPGIKTSHVQVLIVNLVNNTDVLELIYNETLNDNYWVMIPLTHGNTSLHTDGMVVMVERAPEHEAQVRRSPAQWLPPSRLVPLVISPVVVGVEELFEPLQELKVVLEATLHQLVHGNHLGKSRASILVSSLTMLPTRKEF